MGELIDPQKEFFGNEVVDSPNPEYGNFQQLLKQVLSVPKEKIDERRAEYEREKKDMRAG